MFHSTRILVQVQKAEYGTVFLENRAHCIITALFQIEPINAILIRIFKFASPALDYVQIFTKA
jgi:hypothetical protein